MKWIIRTWAFGITLVLGVSAAALVDLLAFEPRPVSIEEYEKLKEMQNAVINGTGVRVTYVGWEPSTSETVPYLKVQVENDSWHPLTYRAHGPQGAFPALSVNGREIEPLGRCGTGMETFFIAPGASAIMYVNVYEFTNAPKEEDEVRIGFYLRKPFEENYKLYTSEGFSIPMEFRKAIMSRSL